MFLKTTSMQSPFFKQSGLGLPVAIFIITIMSIIAVATRSFYAAESGAQLRAEVVLRTLPCSCGANATYNFSVPGLNACRAVTSCDEFVANGDTFCTITSIGSCDNINAQRTIEVRLK